MIGEQALPDHTIDAAKLAPIAPNFTSDNLIPNDIRWNLFVSYLKGTILNNFGDIT